MNDLRRTSFSVAENRQGMRVRKAPYNFRDLGLVGNGAFIRRAPGQRRQVAAMPK